MSVYSEVDPLPDGLSIVQVGLVDWDLAKNYRGAEIALKADVKRKTLRALKIPALRRLPAAARLRRVPSRAWRRWRRRTGRPRNARRWSSRSRRPRIKSPIGDADWLRRLQVIEGDARQYHLGSTRALTSSQRMITLRPHQRSLRLSRAGLKGGIGWGLPGLCPGVSLANPDRPVVCYSSDGSSMLFESSHCGPRRTTSCR